MVDEEDLRDMNEHVKKLEREEERQKRKAPVRKKSWHVRNMDTEAVHQLKIKAVQERMNINDALREAIYDWIKKKDRLAARREARREILED